MATWKNVTVIKKFIMKILNSGSIYNLKTFYNNTNWSSVYMSSFIGKFTMNGGCSNKVVLNDSFSNTENFSSNYSVENKYYRKFVLCDFNTPQMPSTTREIHQITPETCMYSISFSSNRGCSLYVNNELKLSGVGNKQYFLKLQVQKNSKIRLVMGSQSASARLCVYMLSENYFTDVYEKTLTSSGAGDVQLSIQPSKKMIIRCVPLSPDPNGIQSTNAVASIVFNGVRYTSSSLKPFPEDVKMNGFQDIFCIYLESNTASTLKFALHGATHSNKNKFIIQYMDESKLQYKYSNEYGLLAFEK